MAENTRRERMSRLAPESYALLAIMMNVARTPLPEGKQPGMPHFPN